VVIRPFFQQQVVDWSPTLAILSSAHCIYRLKIPHSESWDRAEARQQWHSDQWAETFAHFLANPHTRQITGLAVSTPEDISQQVVADLVAAQRRLPNLTALLLGDCAWDEQEMVWADQSDPDDLSNDYVMGPKLRDVLLESNMYYAMACDVTPLLRAYPHLQQFGVLGHGPLHLGPIQYEHLQSLVVEGDALGDGIVDEIMRSELPHLEHLEVWLSPDDTRDEPDHMLEFLAPLFTGVLFPKLCYLGLRDTDISDEIALALAQSPLIERLRELDLSLGTLSDEGAEALIACPAVRTLEKLDIHHHYCSPEMIRQLQELGISLDASEPRTVRSQ
jgi:hypothetical protein